MMLTTHILAGFFIAAAAPWKGVLVAAAVGSVAPDFDMFLEHRKTFHRPLQYVLLTAALILAAPYLPYAVYAAIFFLAASLHCFMDVLSNGKTMRPREMTDDRAVYNHVTKSWIEPKRLLFDGSVRDLAVSAILAASVTVMTGFRSEVFVILAASLCYFFFKPFVTQRLSGYDRFSEFFRSLI